MAPSLAALGLGRKKTKIFWHQSEARIIPTVWNWSVKTMSPGALILVLDFSSPEFFSRLFRLSLPPLTAPGSPRMIIRVFINLTVPFLRFYHNLNNLRKLFFGLEMTLCQGTLQINLQRS